MKRAKKPFDYCYMCKKRSMYEVTKETIMSLQRYPGKEFKHMETFTRCIKCGEESVPAYLMDKLLLAGMEAIPKEILLPSDKEYIKNLKLGIRNLKSYKYEKAKLNRDKLYNNKKGKKI